MHSTTPYITRVTHLGPESYPTGVKGPGTRIGTKDNLPRASK